MAAQGYAPAVHLLRVHYIYTDPVECKDRGSHSGISLFLRDQLLSAQYSRFVRRADCRTLHKRRERWQHNLQV